jgi:hypothetical protein
VPLEDVTDWKAVLPPGTASSDADLACQEALFSGLSTLATLAGYSGAARPHHLPRLLKLLSALSRTLTAEGAGEADVAETKEEESLAVAVSDDPATWHASLLAPNMTAVVTLTQRASRVVRALLLGNRGMLGLELHVLQLLGALLTVVPNVLAGCRVQDVGIANHLPQAQLQVPAPSQPFSPALSPAAQ